MNYLHLNACFEFYYFWLINDILLYMYFNIWTSYHTLYVEYIGLYFWLFFFFILLFIILLSTQLFVSTAFASYRAIQWTMNQQHAVFCLWAIMALVVICDYHRVALMQPYNNFINYFKRLYLPTLWKEVLKLVIVIHTILAPL